MAGARLGRSVRLLGHSGRSRFALVLAVLGPGLIAAAADNDAGGITTWSVIGARYGYSLLWLLLLITPILAVTQEMGARMGAVTGKGLAALIRERFSLRLMAFAMLALLLANLGTTVAEFSGVAAAFGLAGIPSWLAVPPVAAGVWLLVTRGSYRRVERIFLFLTTIYAAYVIAGLLAHPDWHAAARGTFVTVGHRLEPVAPHGGGRDRHDHHALGPVLHPGLRGRQARRAARLQVHAARGVRGGRLHRRHRPVHRRRLRGDALQGGHRRRDGPGRRPGARADRR